MSAQSVDVLAVMGSDAHCAAESRSRHYDHDHVAALSANSDRARAAVAELIERDKQFRREFEYLAQRYDLPREDRERWAALAACGVRP
jgi:hypothetical protein